MKPLVEDCRPREFRLQSPPNLIIVTPWMHARHILGATCALLPLGCLQTVDLRRSASQGDAYAGDAACGPDERVNPSTGACEPCFRTEPHPSRFCPCGYEYQAAPFPYCDDPRAHYECDDVCRGDIGVCNAYWPEDGSVRACGQLFDCCRLLAQDPGSTPCCPPGESLVCIETDGSYWSFRFECVGPSCCAADCTEDDDCDTTFQTCAYGRCVPGCDPDVEYCHDGPTGCECRRVIIP